MTSKERRLIPAPPVGPGSVLRNRILVDGLTQEKLADAMKVSRFSINQIVNGRRTVTAEMAMRLAMVTSTSPAFWLKLQQEVDLYEAERKLADELESLQVLRNSKNDAALFVDVD